LWVLVVFIYTAWEQVGATEVEYGE
jgi:hypothetical protein